LTSRFEGMNLLSFFPYRIMTQHLLRDIVTHFRE
jgi:hypothetical protein